jgi:hypothetical protein
MPITFEYNEDDITWMSDALDMSAEKVTSAITKSEWTPQSIRMMLDWCSEGLKPSKNWSEDMKIKRKYKKMIFEPAPSTRSVASGGEYSTEDRSGTSQSQGTK